MNVLAFRASLEVTLAPFEGSHNYIRSSQLKLESKNGTKMLLLPLMKTIRSRIEENDLIVKNARNVSRQNARILLCSCTTKLESCCAFDLSVRILPKQIDDCKQKDNFLIDN